MYIRPRAGVILTDEDKVQAALYRRQLDSKWERQLANADSVAEIRDPISPGGFRGYCAYLPQEPREGDMRGSA